LVHADFLLGIFFDPEMGDDIFFLKLPLTFKGLHGVMPQKIGLFITTANENLRSHRFLSFLLRIVVLFCVMRVVCVLCLIVVPLPSGEYPFAVKKKIIITARYLTHFNTE
jgi:hypothetical protein